MICLIVGIKKEHQLLDALCREDRIRTCDPLVPNQVRYRPALLPELISYQVRYSRNCGTTSRTFIFQVRYSRNCGTTSRTYIFPGALLPQLRDYFLNIFNCGGGGIRTRGTELPVRQFSKLLISATHPPHRLKPIVSGTAKLLKNMQSPKDLCN